MSDSGSSSTRSTAMIAEHDTRELEAPPSSSGPAIRIVLARDDDPTTVDRLVAALADVLSGRVG